MSRIDRIAIVIIVDVAFWVCVYLLWKSVTVKKNGDTERKYECTTSADGRDEMIQK